MERKAHSGSNGRNFRGTRQMRSKSVSIPGLAIAAVAAIAVGAGIYYGAAHRMAAPQPMSNATPAQKLRRASPETLETLSQLRNRYTPVPQRQTNGNSDSPDSELAAATQASPLLPGLTDDFETNPAGILARFPASSGKPEAKVVLPSRANAAFQLQDIGTGMHVQAQLEGAQDKAAEMADGYAIYRQALGPNTTLLRRAMPSGSEDFVSFAEAPNEPSVTYHVGLDSNVAGLRLAGNSLELLDKDGTPRLRVAPPYIVSADGEWLEAKLTLSGCAADTDPTAPWSRTVTAPGASSCQLRVSWDNDSVEYPALLDPTWVTTGSMNTARQGHTATLLSNGKVLVAGGNNGTTALATAELYDRTTGTWAATGSFTGARQWHTAVQLNASSNPTTSGKVLIAGGRSGSASLYTAQLYSPSAGTWMAATNLNGSIGREQHTATLLPSGKVLVAGGVNGTSVLATAATYDPSSGAGTWTATTAPMPAARKFHAATLISTTNQQLNGKVLVTGGSNGSASQTSVYLYDPVQLAFSTLANMAGSAREGHTATVLANTKILLAGGKNNSTTLNTAVVYDPTTGPGSWSTVGNLNVARQGHSASLLSTGQVLVAGGSNGTTTLNSAELYNGPAWVTTTVMPDAVQAHTATLLSNNIVLIAGGLKGTTTQSATRLYDVTGGNPCSTNSQCLSGSCVSGVCCNTACTDQCYSCSLAGLGGICSPKTGGSCNDGNACTQTDTCSNGTCVGSNPKVCPNPDQCHNPGTCNPSNGICSNPNKDPGTPCNDGNLCTQTDTCMSGICTGTNLVICTASDQCHGVGTCNPSSGTCSNPNVLDGTPCNDGNACTSPDQCVSGTCHAGPAVPVDDGNPCTTDACSPTAGVSNQPVAAGTPCTDGDVCNGTELCNDFALCLAGAPLPVSDGNPCTADTCDPATGNIAHQPLAAGTACPDGNLCNGDETCSASVTCLPGTPPVISDGDPCTTDYCVPATGVQHVQLEGNCTPCTVGGTPCPAPANPCLTSFCSARLNQCFTVVADGRACDDGNPATTNEICIYGGCGVPNVTLADGQCGTDAVYADQLIKTGEIPHDTTSVEWENMLKEAGGGGDKAAVISMTLADPLVVPVAVHVLEYPGGPTIDDAQIVDAIAGLNAKFTGVDMTRIRPVFRPVALSSRIRFELAKRTPTCGSFSGIERIQTNKSIWYPCDGFDPQQGGVAPWDENNYINIYIGAMQRITTIPGCHGIYDNNVQIGWDYVNASSSVLAHEVAHIFGLKHVDDDVHNTCAGNDDSTCSTGGDAICDTPAFPYSSEYCPALNQCDDSLKYFAANPPDPDENYMNSLNSPCTSMFTREQVNVMESRFAMAYQQIYPLVGSSAFSPPVTGADLWIRDGQGDDGSEPNFVEYPWWTDDIWVRRIADDIEVHENPLYSSTGAQNHVYVRVRNRSCNTAASGAVHLYWAKAATDLQWPDPWTGNVSLPDGNGGNVTIGGEITSTDGVDTGSIAPGGSTVLNIPWNPPNPADFVGLDADKSHFCLLACIGDCPAMTGVGGLPSWVRKHNDVAQKNVSVVGENDDLIGYLSIGGYAETGTNRLVFETPVGIDSSNSIFAWTGGTVLVDLGSNLFNEWKLALGFGTNIEEVSGTSTVKLLGSGATINGLPLLIGDFITIRIIFQPPQPPSGPDLPQATVYYLSVKQQREMSGADGGSVEDVGGQIIQIKTFIPADLIYQPSP